MRCAHDLAFGGEPERFGLATEDFGEAKVSDFHAAFAVREHVLGFDVAVDNAFVVRLLQRVANLWNNLQRFTRREASGAFELAQDRTIHKFHDEKAQAVHLPEFVNGHAWFDGSSGIPRLCPSQVS